MSSFLPLFAFPCLSRHCPAHYKWLCSFYPPHSPSSPALKRSDWVRTWGHHVDAPSLSMNGASPGRSPLLGQDGIWYTVLTNALERPQKGAEAHRSWGSNKGFSQEYLHNTRCRFLVWPFQYKSQPVPTQLCSFSLNCTGNAEPRGWTAPCIYWHEQYTGKLQQSAVPGVVNGICQLGSAKVPRYFGLDMAVKVFYSDEMTI